jgi:hypothetical protein
MSLVSELQHEALNDKASVVGLLRKALLVARKLELDEFAEWAEKELDGYGETTPVPEYREVNGVVHADDGFGGYQVLQWRNGQDDKRFSRMQMNNPISELEHLVAGADRDGTIVMSYSPKLAKRLMDAMNPPRQPSLHVQIPQLRKILDAVRTAILKWALQLERDGITGENMSFSKQEKEKASQTTVNIENYIGSMHQSQFQKDVKDSTQTIKVNDLDLKAVAELVTQIELAVRGEKIESGLLAEIQADVAALKAQLASPKPKQSIIRECLGSLRRVLEEAGGNLVASGLPTAIGVIVGP